MLVMFAVVPRLASVVIAHQANHLARAHREADIIQRMNGAIPSWQSARLQVPNPLSTYLYQGDFASNHEKGDSRLS